MKGFLFESRFIYSVDWVCESLSWSVLLRQPRFQNEHTPPCGGQCYPVCVLGAVCAFVELFCGYSSPEFDTVDKTLQQLS